MFNIGSNKSYKKVKEDNCVVVYEVNVDEKTTGEMENNATLKLQSVVSLPGFRVGKVPPGMIKQQFPSMVKDEVLDLAAKSAVNEIIENEKTYPVVAPVIGKINYEPSRKISFELKLEVNPRFEPKKYEKIQVTRKTHKVSEEDIDKRLKLIREYNAYLKSVDENAVVAGNHYVIVDYEIYENGVKSENGDFKGDSVKARETLKKLLEENNFYSEIRSNVLKTDLSEFDIDLMVRQQEALYEETAKELGSR